jgi:hypothetical protein
MATNPAQPPVPNAPTPADHYDEHSGVYGFFRRHQKKLLYTAGMFVLLTFSITGAMTTMVQDLFATERPMPTIVVNGKQVKLATEDYDVGQRISRYLGVAIPEGVLPILHPGEGSETELANCYAILRRAAIATGIEASLDEVDRAIDALRERAKLESAAVLARNLQFGSFAEYRGLVAEAMRIGTYVRLQTLAIDSSDARVLHLVLDQREKITLRVATFDEKKAEEELKASKPVSEEDLKKWLEGKTERDKRMMQAYDPPLVELRVGALLLADGQFDPQQWQEGYLKDFTVSDEMLQSYYNMEKEGRFKLEAGGHKPADDAAVKTELTRLVQADEVMKKVLKALQDKQGETLKPLTDAEAAAQTEVGTTEASIAELTAKITPLRQQKDAKTAELAQKPDDPSLTEALAKITAELDPLELQSTQANEKLPAQKTARDAAVQATKDARANWNFTEAFQEVTKDKAGIALKQMAGMKSGEELKDLDAVGLDLGKWPMSVQATALRNKGDLAFAPGRAQKGVFVYQATNVDSLPIKPWEKLKPIAEGAYYTEQIKKVGEEKKKAMEEALLRLAKEKMPEKVAEIEGAKQKRVDEKLAAWEKDTQAAITAATETLKNLQSGTQAYGSWKLQLEAKQAELARKDQQKNAFELEVQNAIETEIAAEAKKHHKDVLDAAAAAAGFTVTTIGPLPRDVEQRDPTFAKQKDSPALFLMRGQSKLKEGETSGLVQDFTGRAYHVAVCTKVEPLTPADVQRRDYESLRTGDGRAAFATDQTYRAYRQAFTLKALEARYQLQNTVGEMREEASKK